MLVTATVEIRIFPSLSWDKISPQLYYLISFYFIRDEECMYDNSFLDIHL